MNFGTSLVSIGTSAFNNCPQLELVTTLFSSTPAAGPGAGGTNPATYSAVFPESLVSLGAYAFQGSNFESVYLPGRSDDTGGLETIESDTFQYCANLARVFVSDGVTLIKADAFLHGLFFISNKLRSLRLPAGVTIENAFATSPLGRCPDYGLYESVPSGSDARAFCDCDTGDTTCFSGDDDTTISTTTTTTVPTTTTTVPTTSSTTTTTTVPTTTTTTVPTTTTTTTTAASGCPVDKKFALGAINDGQATGEPQLDVNDCLTYLRVKFNDALGWNVHNATFVPCRDPFVIDCYNPDTLAANFGMCNGLAVNHADYVWQPDCQAIDEPERRRRTTGDQTAVAIVVGGDQLEIYLSPDADANVIDVATAATYQTAQLYFTCVVSGTVNPDYAGLVIIANSGDTTLGVQQAGGGAGYNIPSGTAIATLTFPDGGDNCQVLPSHPATGQESFASPDGHAQVPLRDAAVMTREVDGSVKGYSSRFIGRAVGLELESACTGTVAGANWVMTAVNSSDPDPTEFTVNTVELVSRGHPDAGAVVCDGGRRTFVFAARHVAASQRGLVLVTGIDRCVVGACNCHGRAGG